MIRAYRLYTGPDGNSHVTVGSIRPEILVNARSIHFKETPAHSKYDWHNDPVPQYVLTLSGILEFTTESGEAFTIKPGDVLLAEDHTGTGHKWRLLNDDSWRRAYVIFAPGADTQFIPDKCVDRRQKKATTERIGRRFLLSQIAAILLST